MLSADDGRTVKDLVSVPDSSPLSPRGIAVYAPTAGPRRVALLVSGATYLSDDGGVTQRKVYVGKTMSAVLFDQTGRVLDGWVGDRWIRLDPRTGAWLAQPPMPEGWAKSLVQQRSDNASPLGLYGLSVGYGATRGRLLVYR
jgi:hypothetical protein